MTLSSRRFLIELREEIENHPAVNHLFLNRLATAPMSTEDYRVFAENHYPLVCVFTSYLELLLLRAPDSEARLWLAKVLVDEYGEGSEGKDHATMYARFLTASGGSAPDLTRGALPAPATEFVRTHSRMVRTRPFLEGLGAVGPGHEWAIPKMFDALIPGLRRAGFDEEAIAYFTLHVEQDDDHGTWLQEALARYCHTEEARQEVRRGAMASLAARGHFWDGVQKAVIRYRQPRATRPDGPVPRTILHELALTAWDGSQTARRAEGLFRRMQQRGRPSLPVLLQESRRLG